MPSHISKYGTLFKFEKDDLFVNRIKTYPKTEFFIYTSSIYLNNSNQEFESPNTKNGHINLYEMNVNRSTSELIYPFITKQGSFTSFNTLSIAEFTQNYDAGDKIVGNYVLTSSYHVERFGVDYGGTKKKILSGLKNTLNFYNTLSPHFEYEYQDRTISSLETNYINLVQIPSIFYGSSIKKGSIRLKYYITGTLIAEAADINKNGELIQTTGTLQGETIGIALYNEGFLLLTSSAGPDSGSLKGPSGSANQDRYGPEAGAAWVSPSWQYFATKDSYTRAPSSSFSIEFNGINYIETLTMFAHAKENQLNFSNNPTFLSGNIYVISGSTFYAQNNKAGLKNIVSSSYSSYSASFKPTTYISKVGIYDKDKNLIAIAAVANPVKKTEERGYTFKLKLDI